MKTAYDLAGSVTAGGDTTIALSSSDSKPAVVLTIAGLDPSCGAGITADLKTFAAHGYYGICCPTALTVQSTQGVERLAPVEAQLVKATLDCLVADTPPLGIKVGMLANASVANSVADFLDACDLPRNRLVLDPVIASSSGAALIDGEGLKVLRTRLLQRIGWITPNVDEIAILLDEPRATAAGIPEQAKRLRKYAADASNPELRIVVTGGHLEPPNDYFLDSPSSGTWARSSAGDSAGNSAALSATGVWLAGERVDTKATHGTGCAFSSALLCSWLEKPGDPSGAVMAAKEYVAGALRFAYPIGRGKGPVNHFFAKTR